MTKRMGWIVGALATALWVAPAVAQTGATSDSARAGTGAATTAPPTSTTGASNSETEKPGRSSESGTAGEHSSAESETLQKLHAGNQAEIEAGRWMQQHAQNSKVKDFAKKMVKDHTDMDKDVQKFAQKQGISLTGGASGADAAKDEQHTHMMMDMPAAQADRHYMTMMVEDHQRDVSEVRSAAEQAKSSNDKDFAKLLDRTAKKMEGHLKDARKIQRDMGSRQARTPGKQ